MGTSALQQGFERSPLASLIKCLVNFPKPLLAAAHGKAIGGVATLLLHCDLVVAAADTQFRLPFTSLGAGPEVTSSFLLPRAAGSRLASQLLLLGNTVDANTTLRAGFVNQLVEPGDELALTLQWAEQLASLAPNSVQTTKRSLRQAQQAGLSAVVAREGEAEHRIASQGDTAAGQRWSIGRDGKARSALACARSASALRAGGQCPRSGK
jgi:enoyl-CoA hydratase/carnithine racemase